MEPKAWPAGVALPIRGPTEESLRVSVNGVEQAARIEPRVSLLDFLRERLDLTGTKKGCDQGTCGACTVWVDGRRVLSCLTLAIACEGREVTTIEGLATADRAAPDAAGLHRPTTPSSAATAPPARSCPRWRSCPRGPRRERRRDRASG